MIALPWHRTVVSVFCTSWTMQGVGIKSLLTFPQAIHHQTHSRCHQTNPKVSTWEDNELWETTENPKPAWEGGSGCAPGGDSSVWHCSHPVPIAADPILGWAHHSLLTCSDPNGKLSLYHSVMERENKSDENSPSSWWDSSLFKVLGELCSWLYLLPHQRQQRGVDNQTWKERGFFSGFSPSSSLSVHWDRAGHCTKHCNL